MFNDILNQILEDLNNSHINNLDEYIYELHEILPNYIVNVPEQNSEEFYEFAGKMMQHVIDNYYLQELPITVAETFKRCPDEICSVNNALASQSGEDITDDVIKILFCFVDASGNTLTYSEDLENTLDLIFTYINHDWANMVGVTLDWDRVCQEVLPSDEIEDDANFGLEALFSFVCVDGQESAEHALELIYAENGWIGHPENEIEAGTYFPNYGVINQEEADCFNANMNAIFEWYNGDPCEYALRKIDPEQFEDKDDFVASGYKSTSNLGGKEIQLSYDGDAARIKFEDGTISDWYEITYDVDGRAYLELTDLDDFEYLDTYSLRELLDKDSVDYSPDVFDPDSYTSQYNEDKADIKNPMRYKNRNYGLI